MFWILCLLGVMLLESFCLLKVRVTNLQSARCLLGLLENMCTTFEYVVTGIPMPLGLETKLFL